GGYSPAEAQTESWPSFTHRSIDYSQHHPPHVKQGTRSMLRAAWPLLLASVAGLTGDGPAARAGEGAGTEKARRVERTSSPGGSGNATAPRVRSRGIVGGRCRGGAGR